MQPNGFLPKGVLLCNKNIPAKPRRDQVAISKTAPAPIRLSTSVMFNSLQPLAISRQFPRRVSTLQLRFTVVSVLHTQPVSAHISACWFSTEVLKIFTVFFGSASTYKVVFWVCRAVRALLDVLNVQSQEWWTRFPRSHICLNSKRDFLDHTLAGMVLSRDFSDDRVASMVDEDVPDHTTAGMVVAISWITQMVDVNSLTH